MNRGRISRALARFLLLGLIAGCGSGKLGLTGGSIPIGTASLRGVVVRGDDVNKVVEGANVTLRRDSDHNDEVTDSAGSFDLGKFSGGTLPCSVVPPDGTATLRDNWTWDLPIPDGIPAQLVVALWPTNFDPNSVKSVTLAPQEYTLRVGETIKFVATAKDKNGVVLHVMPSLLLTGTAASLSPNGAVTATSPGTALLTAWLNGNMATATVHVIP